MEELRPVVGCARLVEPVCGGGQRMAWLALLHTYRRVVGAGPGGWFTQSDSRGDGGR
jgi:hypothetical protein